MLEIGDPDFKHANCVTVDVGTYFDIGDICFFGTDNRSYLRQYAPAIFAKNPDLDLVSSLLSQVPAYLNLAFRVTFQHVFTVPAVDGNSPAPGNETDDRISRKWIAALGKVNHDVINVFYANSLIVLPFFVLSIFFLVLLFLSVAFPQFRIKFVNNLQR